MKNKIGTYFKGAIMIFAFSASLFTFSCKDDDEKPIYTVIVESNGGTNYAPIRVGEGETVPEKKLFPPPIIDDGGKFVGWFADADLENEFDFTSPVTDNLTIYAKWFYVTHTVSFVMNGADAKPDVQVREGSQLELEIPEYEGHMFVDWYEDSGFTKHFNPSTIITEDITLYARWAEESPSSWFGVDANGVLVSCNPPEGTTTVVIPEGVKVIPAWFVLANGLNEPGVPGFPDGKNIQEFILPESVEEIGMGAFKFAAITSIKIPSKIKTLEPNAFMECNQLSSFTFAPNSQLEKVTSNDGNEPVISSTSLEFISFPPSLQYMGKYTLTGCTALKILTFERDESPVIFYSYLPGGGVWLFGGYFPNKIRVPNSVKDSFISEMRKVMGDYEFDKMSTIVEGY